MQRYGLRQTVAPTQEIVSLDDVKEFLRLDTDDYDLLLQGLVIAAREHIEMWTRRQLALATFAMTLDCWPTDSVIVIPRAPLVAVDTVLYLDGAGVETVIDSSAYSVDTASLLGRITPSASASWPSLATVINAVTVTFQAGYAPGKIPETAKTVAKMLVADMFEHAEAQLEMRIDQNRTYSRLLAGLTIEEFV